ncbi:IclR family transcriptional regulator [Kutzneria sp. CA-103260]|uniref:IclR family transcriptional regulator n=1 Tax=Kutzneria sp. CA-103260 TaxID=2802641 RepID=UPI001BAB5D21|nr:IclR family transcriptional regulator [Kutzneria sp. CA-103260]QUQ64671.1 IclR family transcriptional regulator [Kutzneria sp. CA-103260]
MPNDPYGAASVGNALRTLLYLRGREAVRLTDVSEHLGIARSTAHRLLSTLRAYGFVEQEVDGKRYRLGPSLLALARGIADERTLIRIARPHLEVLRDATQETSNLLVLDGADAFFLDGAESPRTLRVGTRTGDHVPAYSAAGGKVLLAELPPETVRSQYPTGLNRLTAGTLSDVDALLAELAACRARGYALNLGESVAEVHAIGVPIRDPVGRPVAAITIAAPGTRLDPADADRFLPPLREAAAGIAASLR